MLAESDSPSAVTLPCNVCVVNWSAGVKFSLKLRCVNLESGFVVSSVDCTKDVVLELATKPAVTPF